MGITQKTLILQGFLFCCFCEIIGVWLVKFNYKLDTLKIVFDFRSVGCCGEIPLNENNEATLLGVLMIIRSFLNIIYCMNKFVLVFKLTFLVVSNLLA
jgi:hypothetical protein